MPNDKFARLAIYGLTSLTLFACCFFWIGARGYAAESVQPNSAGAAQAAESTEAVVELSAPALATRQAPVLPALLPAALPGPGEPAPPDSTLSTTAPDTEAAARALAEAQLASEQQAARQAAQQAAQSSEPSLAASDAEPEPEPVSEPESSGPAIDEAALAAELERMTALGHALGAVTAEYKGSFHATAYCAEAYPHICGGNGITASGTVPTPGLTAAADWGVLPAGTWLYIEGVGIRRVEDSGSAIKQNSLDINVDTHANALAWYGYGSHEVWVLS